jgi:hypothetical protein
MKVDTRYPLSDTTLAYEALAEFKSAGLEETVYPFLKQKLLATARDLIAAGKHIEQEVLAMDAMRNPPRKKK